MSTKTWPKMWQFIFFLPPQTSIFRVIVNQSNFKVNNLAILLYSELSMILIYSYICQFWHDAGWSINISPIFKITKFKMLTTVCHDFPVFLGRVTDRVDQSKNVLSYWLENVFEELTFEHSNQYFNQNTGIYIYIYSICWSYEIK